MTGKALRTLVRGLRRVGEAATGGFAEDTDTGRRERRESSSREEPDDRAPDGSHDESGDRTAEEAGTRTRSDIIAETGMTPAEFVHGLLDAHGGRAYQGTVGEETGLSKSATSRLLTRMEEDGQVTRVSIGREKVVCLPNHEPEISEDSDGEEVPSGV